MGAQDEPSGTAGAGFEIDMFREADADGVGRLFRSVYGEAYPMRYFYDPAELIERTRSGRTHLGVARTTSGEILGQLALFRIAPYPGVYEAGAGLVLLAHRGGGINRALVEFVYEPSRLAALGVQHLYGEAVCNHLHMQKAHLRSGWCETGLAIDLMPAAAYDAERSAAGRVSSVLLARACTPQPHTVHVPRCYARELEFIYAGLDDRRELAFDDGTEAEGATAFTVEIFEFAGVARVHVSHIGRDFAEVVTRWLSGPEAARCTVHQFWLCLGAEGVERAARALQGHGAFLGGVAPRWFDTDALLLQRLTAAPNWDGIQLYSERAKEMLRLERADAERQR